MSELHEPITDIAEILRLPAERELPAVVRTAQRQMLLTQISSESLDRSLSRRLLARARVLGVRIGLLVFLVTVCIVSGTAANGMNGAAKSAEITAAAGAAATVGLAAVRVDQRASSIAKRHEQKPIYFLGQLSARPGI